jgi:SAM-dependent methyltransferase
VSEYLLDNALELERLRVQSEVWEPAGRALLERLGPGDGRRALDLGCGSLGWLRILHEAGWHVTGSDVATNLLDAARSLALPVELVEDDVFDSRLPEHSFDLVHARFLIAPLGRADDLLAAYRRLVAPGGVLVLEESHSGSWRVFPEAPAVADLIERIVARFRERGGDFDAGRRLHGLLGECEVDAHVVALPPGHPYLRLPLQFARSLGLEDTEAAAAELADPGCWGLSFTVVQAWRRL